MNCLFCNQQKFNSFLRVLINVDLSYVCVSQLTCECGILLRGRSARVHSGRLGRRHSPPTSIHFGAVYTHTRAANIKTLNSPQLISLYSGRNLGLRLHFINENSFNSTAIFRRARPAPQTARNCSDRRGFRCGPHINSRNKRLRRDKSKILNCAHSQSERKGVRLRPCFSFSPFSTQRKGLSVKNCLDIRALSTFESPSDTFQSGASAAKTD